MCVCVWEGGGGGRGRIKRNNITESAHKQIAKSYLNEYDLQQVNCN